MKYRNTFKATTRKGRAALLLLALAAALFALHGALGTRGASAQEKAPKPPRSTRMDSLLGTRATTAGRSRKPAKPVDGPAPVSAGALACDFSGTGTPISYGQTINGALDLQDCDFGDSTRFDIYNFDANTAGQQITVTLTSGGFDTYLFLVYDADTSGTFTQGDFEVGEDDDGVGGGSTNSRIPSGTGVATLPFLGRYFIIVNSFPPDQGDPVPTGAYSLTLTGTATPCAPTAGITLGQGPINGSLGSPDCRFVDDSFFDAYSFAGFTGKQISISLTSAYTQGGSAVAYLLDSRRNILAVAGGAGSSARLPASGVVTLPSTQVYYVVVGSTARTATFNPTPTGNYTLTLADGGQCPTSAITPGQTVNGALAGGDCVLPDGTLADFYTFSGTAGQQIAVAMSSTAFDTYLFLNGGPDGGTIAENDDGGGGPNDTDSRIPSGSGFITLPSTGTYTILANSFPPDAGDPTPTGAYTLSLLQPPPAPTQVQFSTSDFTVTEGFERSVLLTVTRSGDTAGETTVNYATNGASADERKDYTAAFGRLRFAVGQTSKTVEVVITDDAFAESPEIFTISLSDPVGGGLGARSSATVTIISNDNSPSGPSPVRDASFNTEFFVRQHYADFLNRVPDAGGLAFWMNNIDSCTTNECREARKVDTSAAFFLAIEFQETGFLAVRTHKVAFGDLAGKPVPLTIRSFLSDSRQLGEGVIVGTAGWPQQLEANKVAYFNEFVTRPAFLARYPESMTAAAYVDLLFGTADVIPATAERDAAIAAFGAGGTSGRAAALRSVAESQTLKSAETNKAFVLMQYFGYLRRNPDDTDFRGIPDPNFEGYNFWLTKHNSFGGNYVAAEMVKAFIQSIEYGDRFGQ